MTGLRDEVGATKVTISSGGKSIETTVGQMQKAAGVIGKDGKLLEEHASPKKPARKTAKKGKEEKVADTPQESAMTVIDQDGTIVATGKVDRDGGDVLLMKTPEATRPPRKIGSKLANTTGAQLRSFIERIERLEEEKAALGADIREVYAEAKSNGYDPKIMRMVVRLRKLDPNERAEQEALLDTYLGALGMIQ